MDTQPPSIDPELDKLNRDMAREAWRRKEDLMIKTWDYAVITGLEAIKGTAVFGGASLAALIAFVGANARTLAGQASLVEAAASSLAIALVLAIVALGTLHLSMRLYALSASSFEKEWRAPYIMTKTSPHQLGGNLLTVVTVTCMIVSYWHLANGFHAIIKLLRISISGVV
jgi:hypothetical protein